MTRYYHFYAIILGLILSNRALAFDFEVGGFHYTITSANTATIEQIDNVTEEVTIPETVSFEGHKLQVTAIGAGLIPFSDRAMIRKVVLPETIQTIGYGTFLYCESLEQINLPKDLKVIESEAFNQCRQLQINDWPGGLCTIGEYAFAACENLNAVQLPSSLESIGRNAFNSSGITSLHIDSGSAVSFGDYAFINCMRLKEVTVDADVKDAISQEMFRNCQSLESAIFNGTIIGQYGQFILSEAFCGCISLKTVVLPKGVTRIYSQAFQDCSSLESIDLGDRLTELNVEAFANCGLRSINLPETLTAIGPAVFRGCQNLESLTLPLRIENVSGYFDSESGIKRLEVKNRKPIGINEFECEYANLFSRVTLVVPSGSKELYAQHDIWGRFEKIEETEPVLYTFYADFSIKGEGRLLWNDQAYSDGERIEVTEGEIIRLKQEPVNDVDSVVWLYLGTGENIKLHRDSVFTFVVTQDVSPSVTFRTIVRNEQVMLTVKQSELGEVKLKINKGKRAELKVEPDDGWKVNCISMNGADITSLLSDNSFFVTEPLQEDSEVVVAFEQSGADTIKDNETPSLRVRANNGTLMIDNAILNSWIDIYTIDGTAVKHLHVGKSTVSTQLPLHRVYLIKNGKTTVKIRL